MQYYEKEKSYTQRICEKEYYDCMTRSNALAKSTNRIQTKWFELSNGFKSMQSETGWCLLEIVKMTIEKSTYMWLCCLPCRVDRDR